MKSMDKPASFSGVTRTCLSRQISSNDPQGLEKKKLSEFPESFIAVAGTSLSVIRRDSNVRPPGMSPTKKPAKNRLLVAGTRLERATFGL